MSTSNILAERRVDMPEDISMVKIFAKMMSEDENLLVKFIQAYIDEINQLEQERNTTD
jgi:hypothetical protein